MTVTASKLRENVYKILDEAIETGLPVEVIRKGKKLKIIVDTPVSKLSRLKKRDTIVGDPEDLVNIDWSHEWSELAESK